MPGSPVFRPGRPPPLPRGASDGADGPLFEALAFARALRGRGASESLAAAQAAATFAVDAEEVARAAGWRGGLASLRRESVVGRLRRRSLR